MKAMAKVGLTLGYTMLSLGACSGDRADDRPAVIPLAATSPPLQAPARADLQVTCRPVHPLQLGCVSAQCTLTPSGGFNAVVTLTCEGELAGLSCELGPNPVMVASASITGLTVAAGPNAPPGPAAIEVVATGGGLRRAFAMQVEIGGRPAPPVSPDALTVYGCAGYRAGIPNYDEVQHFGPLYVGAERCTSTLSHRNGWFVLQVPGRCYATGQSVRLLAGGLESCVTARFRPGTSVFREVLGRSVNRPCP
jgi:hypothetical protein